MKKNLITSPLSMFKHKIFQPTMIKGVLRAAYATKTMKAKAIDHTGNVTVSYWIEPNIKTNFIHQLGLLPKVTDVLPTDLKN